MASKLTVGIQGAPLNNSNMGCVALTYSLVKVLEEISAELNLTFNYMFFDWNIPESCIDRFSGEMNIDKSRIHIVDPYYWSYGRKLNKLRILKNSVRNKNFIAAVHGCNFVIDLTQGDSFSDIYGLQRFYEWSKSKEIIEKENVPFVFGPQTIGPFYDANVKKEAVMLLNNASLIICRDAKSADCVKELTGKEVITGTDLAFALPYDSGKKESSDGKIRIGINPSGLLLKSKSDASDFDNKMKVDYDEYINTLIDKLLADGRYELHIIPHVGDEAAHFKNRNDERIKCYDQFESPIAAKNVISQMDVFIGARMHATIGAFSSGVATIPTSYSRKFIGLYNSVGYDRIVDLETLSTDEALELTLKYVGECDSLRSEVRESMEKVNSKTKFMRSELSKFISGLI